MKFIFGAIIACAVFASCGTNMQNAPIKKSSLPITGTWKLISGTTIQNGDTSVTDYTKNKSFIKIINDTHFAFLEHDLNKGKDTPSASYESGGGPYSLQDSLYSEHLEYCSAREWEGNDFKFTITMQNDTLTQIGIEKVDEAGVNWLNIERYVRLKK